MALFLNCLKIFCCRMVDVTCGVFRTVFTVKEKSIAAALAGFCEVFIWYLVVNGALNSDGPKIVIAAAYAGGYAMGTYCGSKISRKVIKGFLTVQVVTSSRNDSMLSKIREAGYAITVINVNSSEYGSEKYMIMANVDKLKLKDFQTLIKENDPDAFILVEETKSSVGGYIAANR